MSLTRINQNTMAMNAQRNLDINTQRVAQSMERLSSGLRINRASDDPAGLVLSESLRADVSGLDVVQQNVTEGVNLIKTAEAALSEVNYLLRQMKDLALDAASDSNNTADTRSALQSQVESAITTINAIAANTKYGGITLLDGSAGTSANLLDTTNIASMQLTRSAGAGYADVQVTQVANKAQADLSETEDYSAATDTLVTSGTITINGVTIGTYASGVDTVQDVIDDINAASSRTGVTARFDTDHIELNQTSYGSDKGIVYVETAAIFNDGGTAVDWGQDAVATVTWGDGTTSTMNAGKGLSLTDSAGNVINLTEAGNSVTTHNDVGYVTQGQVSFQIGLTASETATMSIGSVAASALGTTGSVAAVDISTVAGAQSALTVIEEAIDQVSVMRAELGAFQTYQLESQGRSLAVARENLAASESAIRDTDFGAEMAEFSTAQILVQSATSFLAQANSLPQNILSLIRG
ncbi:MAG: hypothetical protein HPY44_02460 [Armatimonadetes bacterium]|nr:hypothetical protein [Armatimonadota bacterium]